MNWIISFELWKAVHAEAADLAPSCSRCGWRPHEEIIADAVDAFIEEVDAGDIDLTRYETVQEIASAALQVVCEDFASCDLCGALHCADHEYQLTEGVCTACLEKARPKKRRARRTPLPPRCKGVPLR